MTSAVEKLTKPLTARCGCCDAVGVMSYKDNDTRLIICNDCADFMVVAEQVLYAHSLLYTNGQVNFNLTYRKWTTN